MRDSKEIEVDVVICGAGIAGLTAAYELIKEGRSVAVIEARDRVGGRTMEGTLLGKPFDLGGQWVGPTQTRIMPLIKELKLQTMPQYIEGDQLLEMHGRIARYKGAIPRLPIFALLSADRAIKKLNSMAARLDPDVPWNFPAARELDLISTETWLQRHVAFEKARELLRIAVRAIFSVEASELSMLFFLAYVKGGGTIETLADVEGAAQQDRIVGGAFQIARRLAERIGPEHITLDSPVRRIEQSEGEVRVTSERIRVRARRAIVAMSPNLTLGIDFPGGLAAARTSLARRMPMGSVTKVLVAYERPFWRQQGLSGMAVSDGRPFSPIFDAGLPNDARGFLVGFIEGDESRRLTNSGSDARRKAVLDTLVALFGPQAESMTGYIEKSWDLDPWSGGCYTGFMTPGTMTTLGRNLRAPVGRLHWAGTETATEWMGYFDGAVQSGQRAAREVLNDESSWDSHQC